LFGAGTAGFYAMRMSEFSPTDRLIAQPKCEQCGVPMWLARIEPDKPDHDRRTFECSICKSETIEVVKYR